LALLLQIRVSLEKHAGLLQTPFLQALDGRASRAPRKLKTARAGFAGALVVRGRSRRS
jgi:hypothetical protein